MEGEVNDDLKEIYYLIVLLHANTNKKCRRSLLNDVDKIKDKLIDFSNNYNIVAKLPKKN